MQSIRSRMHTVLATPAAYCFVLMAAFLFGIAGVAHAGTVGKVNGVVKDKSTGLPLPNANVTLVGTSMGANAGAAGSFAILNIPGGTYDFKASFVGYKDVLLQGVQVIPDFTTELAFALEPTVAAIMEAITVGAEKPLIQRDRTGSVRFLGQEELQNQPTRGYQEAAALQAGVVANTASLAVGGAQIEESTNDARLYVRGGRSNEVAYFVDGFSQQDPLTGISTTAINQNAIDQVVVQTGGFDAEYGRIMSGVVNVVTREGGDKYFGSAELFSDAIGGEWVGSKVYDQNLYSASLGGPVPGMSSLSFLVSAESRWERERNPRPIENLGLTSAAEETLRSYVNTPNVGITDEQIDSYFNDGILPNNSLAGKNGQARVVWDMNQSTKLKLGANASKEDWREYRHAYLLNLRHTPRYEDNNQSVYGTLTRTVSPKTYMEVAANYFYTERLRGDGIYFDDLEGYARPDGNPDFNPSLPLFLFGDSTQADGGTVWDDFLHRESAYMGLRGDLTSEWREGHTAKLGVEYRRHTLRRYNHLFPVQDYKGVPEGYVDVDFFGYDIDHSGSVDSDGLNVDLDGDGRITPNDGSLDGAKHPVDAGIYLQNKFEKDDFVVRAGIRYDYLNANTERIKDERRPLGEDNTRLDAEDLIESKAWNKVSPRIGVGFPVGEGTLFHANYGKFFQQPNLEDLYVSYRFLAHKVRTGGYFYPFGNPGLEPEQTTAYEVGLTRQVAAGATFDVGLFYKDVENLVQVQNISAQPNAYSSFRNTDFGTIKGLDFNFDLRRTHSIAASLYYTLSWSKGTGSASQSQRNVAWTNGEPPKQTSPLDFDQRHKITVNLDYRNGKGEGPMINGRHLLERAGVNMIVNLGSGF
ncbi:MAG: TonB-dependent receptor, partial [Candidatus Eisenbacteria bacterium]|nr:TonB-dependent receptor [Candidatus Eisenbacteria bacterium]